MRKRKERGMDVVRLSLHPFFEFHNTTMRAQGEIKTSNVRD